MAKVISLVNQKGGVGKTTTSINLSASLGKLGKRTLLIDLDPQGNTSTGLGINKGDITASVYDCLNGSVTAKKAIIKTRFTNLFIMPATINLAGIDIELIEMTHENNDFKMNEQLKHVLEPIRDNFDYIIIDCPPSLGLLTTNALVASDSVIIPVQCEFFALEGIEEVRRFFNEKVFDTIIPRLIRLVEAPSHGEPINEYDPESRAAKAYNNLAEEVIRRDESN